ncbi:hypothetical protein BT69DRAFT_140045 [Atractiella rhizophila]|nr:hypothetical protein BT69DRAFT_140045 [Atractiella rhizophila]
MEHEKVDPSSSNDAEKINSSPVLVETAESRKRRKEPVHEHFSSLDETETRELAKIQGQNAYLRRKTRFPKPSDIDIIFSDVDGTLITKSHDVHPLNLSAIKHWRSKYPEKPIIVASGRHKNSCLSIRQELGLLDAYAIHCNGGIVYKGSEVVAIRSLSVEAIDSILSTLSDRSLFAFTEDEIVYVNKETNETENWLEVSRSYDGGILDCSEGVEKERFLKDVREGKKKVLKFTCCVDISQIPQLTHKLDHPDFSVTRAIPFILEMNPRGVNKFWAVEQVCSALSIDPRRALAFGDGENDKEMLVGVGYGVCMNNAFPKVKAIGRFITASNDEGGVGAFLMRVDK